MILIKLFYECDHPCSELTGLTFKLIVDILLILTGTSGQMWRKQLLAKKSYANKRHSKGGKTPN